MKDIDPKKRCRRRSCYDRLRMRMLERRRMARTNPAQSAAQQLLAVFAVIFGRVPVLAPERAPARYTPPPMSQRHTQRLDMARRLGVPSRYVDTVLSQGMVPYAVLFDDIRRGGASRRDALTELRKRIPETSLDWLDHIQRWGLWYDLLKCHVPKGIDEDTDIRILKSTLAWLNGKSGGRSNPTGVAPTLKPDGDSEPTDDDDGPSKPEL